MYDIKLERVRVYANYCLFCHSERRGSVGSVSSEKSGKEGTPTPAKKGATPAAKPAPTPKSGKKQVREIKLKLMDYCNYHCIHCYLETGDQA